jgi:hypothetical protein
MPLLLQDCYTTPPHQNEPGEEDFFYWLFVEVSG